jgi:hypothetical protein
MLSTNTWTISARQIIAPSIVVRGTSSSRPPTNSANPVKIWYAGDAPIDVQRRSVSDRCPIGSTSVTSDGAGNCVGMILAMA